MKHDTILQRKVDRRTTLKWLVASLAYSALHGKVLAGTFKTTPGGYGTDPNLNDTKAGWALLLSESELRITAALADLILPGTAESPAPSAIGIHEFIDEWVSAPYPEQLRDRDIVRPGLAWLDEKKFLQMDQTQQLEILKQIATPGAERNEFFSRTRFLVLAAYFSSDAGLKDIGYTGNVALQAFPEPTAEIQAIIDLECKALGI